MSIHYTVYCKKSVANVSPAELLDGLQVADLHTIAESYDIDDDAIEEALEQLRIENLGNGFERYRLSYRPDGVRQIDIERWKTPGEMRTSLAEVLEDLTGQSAAAKIGKHLEHTIDIVDTSFGAHPNEAMAIPLASEVVRWLAEKFDGIIRDGDGKWWELGPKYHEYQPLK